jgi:polyisoprenoid-binding protein YceI
MTTPTTTLIDGVELPAPGTFVLEPNHTTIGFVARHLMVTKVRGRFEDYTGSITIGETLEDTRAEATVQTSSISTGSADRDTHLKSGDFFGVEDNPVMTFRTVRILKHSGNDFRVLTELTVNGVTREVEFEVEYDGIAIDPWGGERIGLSATAEIDREDFGMTWNVAMETGGVLVSKKVKIEIEAQAVRQA